MQLETKYNIGDTVYMIGHTWDDETEEDQFWYAGRGTISAITIAVTTNEGGTEWINTGYTVRRKLANGEMGRTHCEERNAFASKDEAQAEIARRERDEQ